MNTINKNSVNFVIVILILFIFILKTENVISQTVEGNDLNISNGTSSISGLVKPAIEGITIFTIMRGTGYQRTDITDEKGHYEITGLTHGTYSLYVPANATTNYYTFRWSFIEDVPNKNLTGYNITLTPRNSPYLLDQMIIEFYPNISFEEKMNIINSSGSVIMDYNYAITSIENANYYTLNIPDGKTIPEMIELFRSNPKVKLAYPNGISHVGTGISEEGYIEEKSADINEPYSEILLVNNYSGVQYQAKILSELNISSEVAVIVEVRDTSGIDIAKDDTIERQIVKDQLRMEFLRNKTNTVLATLPETEFRLKRKFLLGGFSGSTTKEGFDKLVNDSNIAKIYLNGISYTGLDGIKPIGEKDAKGSKTLNTTDTKLDSTTNLSENIFGSKGSTQKEQKSLLPKFIQFLKSLLKFK